jgi:hypothetical protein
MDLVNVRQYPSRQDRLTPRPPAGGFLKAGEARLRFALQGFNGDDFHRHRAGQVQQLVMQPADWN